MFSPSRSMRLTSALAILLAAALVASGCGKKTSDESAGTSTSTMTDTSTTPPALTDANVAAIVVAANDAEIDLGKLAQSKTKNQQVKSFAKQMETDHTAVNKNATDLAGKLHLTPENNDTSNGLESGAKTMRESLEKMDGAAFDKAYVDNEVTYHEGLLATIDNTLLPATQDPELKQLLTDTRPAVVAHLDHARKLQTQLGSSSSAK
jgi:putative membrane protein